MKRAILGFLFLIVFSFSLFAQAGEFEYVENPAEGGRRIVDSTSSLQVGDRKYFVEDPALRSEPSGSKTKGGGRDYIVRNPRASLPPPGGIPLAKMDSTLEECEVWSQDQRISHWYDRPFGPRVAVVSDTIHIVWYQRFYSKFAHREVCYVRSTDGGASWSDSVLLSVTDGIESATPDISVENNNVYVVWLEWTSMDSGGIYFRKSTDGGTSWQEITPIVLRGPDDYSYYRPTLVSKDSCIFVAFAKNIDLDDMITFKKSIDWGDTWSDEIMISEHAVSGHWSKMVLNTVGLYITYEDGLKIWCNKSTDWGDTWSDDIFISDMEGSIAQWPSIGADENGGIYVSWFDYKYSPYGWTGDIFLRRSTDNGQTWDSIVVLTDNHLCIESDVSADKYSVHVVWHDERHNMEDANFEIYHRRSTTLGVTWSEDTRLTDAVYESEDPRIIKDNSRLYMVWIDNRNEPEAQSVYFKDGLWYYPGDANGDEIINSSDIVYLINFLFIEGPEPNTYEAGDANGDEEINSADVVYLINYLFIGGPAPADC